MLGGRSEQRLFLRKVSFLILESEIRCHLPKMIASLTDGNKFKSVSKVIIPFAVDQIHGQLALAQNILVPVKVVPDCNSRDTLCPTQYQ